MQREVDFEIGIERLKRRRIFLLVDGVKPHALGERLRFQHGRVMRGVDGAETGREGANTLLAVDL